MKALEDGGVGLAEALAVSFLAEDLVVFKEGEDVVLVTLGGGVEAVGHAVDNRDGLTLLVDALGVAGPGGDDGRGQRDLAVVFEVLADNGEQPLGDTVGGLGAQAGDGVLDGGVAKALDELVAVMVQVDAGDRLEGGGALFFHVLEEEGGEAIVANNVVDEAVSGEVAEVAQALVGGVEEAELHELVGDDVVNNLDADLVVIGAALGELLLEDPLGEVFADDRPGILVAVLFLDVLTVLVRGLRGDAVNHGVGERDVLLYPGGQLRIDGLGEAQEHLRGDVTVALDVVAAHHCKRGDALLLAGDDGGGDEAEEGDETGEVVLLDGLDVGGNLRVIELELAGDVVEVVATFGDGQGNDVDGRAGKHRNGVGRIVGSEDVVDDRADDAGVFRTVGELFRQRVEPVLGNQGVAHADVAGHNAHADDAPVEVLPLVHQLVEVTGLVRAVEAADAEVDDGGDDGAAVVGRPGDVCGELIEGALESLILSRPFLCERRSFLGGVVAYGDDVRRSGFFLNGCRLDALRPSPPTRLGHPRHPQTLRGRHRHRRPLRGAQG